MKTLHRVCYSGLLLCIASSVIFYACQKEKSETMSQHGAISLKPVALSDVPGMSKSHFYDVMYRKKNRAMQTAATWLTEKDFAHFVNLFPRLDHVAYVVVYLNDKPYQVKFFNDKTVTGISVCVNKNGNTTHYLFRNTGKGFAEDKAYTIDANEMSTQQFDYVCHEVLGNKTQGWWYITNKENLDFKELKKRNAFLVKMAASNIRLKNGNEEIGAPPGGGGGSGGQPCGDYPGCQDGFPGTLCSPHTVMEGMYKCDYGTCPGMYVRVELEENHTYEATQLNTLFQFTLLYEFKDFLHQSSRGTEMANNYYAIGSFINGVPLSLAMDVAVLLPSVKNRIEMLLHETNTGLTLITPATANQWQPFLNNLKQLSSDPDYELVVDAFIVEVNFLTNKTVGEVRNLYD